jgi:hypothetical protein
MGRFSRLAPTVEIGRIDDPAGSAHRMCRPQSYPLTMSGGSNAHIALTSFEIRDHYG